MEYRCDVCKRLLFKGELKEGKIEIKCKCKNIMVFDKSIKK